MKAEVFYINGEDQPKGTIFASLGLPDGVTVEADSPELHDAYFDPGVGARTASMLTSGVDIGTHDPGATAELDFELDVAATEPCARSFAITVSTWNQTKANPVGDAAMQFDTSRTCRT